MRRIRVIGLSLAAGCLLLVVGCGGGNTATPEAPPEVPPFVAAPPIPTWSLPAWSGQTLAACEDLSGWSVEKDTGSLGSLALVDGLQGKAIELTWDIGSGQWVQARCDFSAPLDLSAKDLFGLSLRGSASEARRVSVMFRDADGVFFGADLDGINPISRWMINLPLPKRLFYHYFSVGTPNTQIDWSRISGLFIAVKAISAADSGGSGRLAIDQIQADAAGLWTAAANFEPILPHARASQFACAYLQAQQQESGLLQSWKEEASPRGYLYDEALGLLVLSREGVWVNQTAVNDAAQAADRLAGFLIAQQKADGHWARAWNPHSGQQLTDDGWVGDQAWGALAMKEYSLKSGSAGAALKAEACAQWLISQMDASGKIAPSTEGTLDTFWALTSTHHGTEAGRVRDYLLGTVWDADLHTFWRGYGTSPDPVVAMDCASWASFFLRHPAVQHPEMGREALSFVRRTLLTTNHDGTLQGFDGMGPVSLWAEGTGQYVCAGGPDAAYFRDVLLSLQRPDGGMPGSTEDWSSTAYGWLSTYTGVAPTAWLYFALTRAPFPMD